MNSTHDIDDLLAQWTELLDELKAHDAHLVPDSLTVEAFIATDGEVATSIQTLPSDEELLHELTIENASNDLTEMIDGKSDEMESTEKKQSSKKVLFEATDLIERFCSFPKRQHC